MVEAMRTKSEARRDAILTVALEVFREVGFDAASMSQIAARVGGSKATLYNYFSSKEELLLEAMLDSAEKHAEDVRNLLKTADDLSEQLHRFVTSLLLLISSDHTTQILRVAISVGGTSDVGRRFYEMGTHQVWIAIGILLKREIEVGNLRATEPETMAMHLRCLCESDLIPNLLGAGKPLNRKQAEQKAQKIVEIFLRAHGPDGA